MGLRDVSHDNDSHETLTSGSLPGKALLSVKDTAQVLGLSQRATYRHIYSGALPHRRLGRRVVVPTDSLRQWLAGEEGIGK